MSGLRKQLEQMVEQEDGWRIAAVTRGGHLRIVHKSGAVAFAAATPSDPRAIKNLRADMRRAVRKKRCSD